MKIQFDTPLIGTDASGDPVTLTATQVAALSYNILLDTVTPPVKSYPVPAANLAAATTNANGSKHVTIDAVNDLKVTLTGGTTYYLAATDNLGNVVSPETAILSDLLVVTPGEVQNFQAS
jgi:hypothetical protein